MGVVMKKMIYRLDKSFKLELMQSRDLTSLKFLCQDIEKLSYLYPNIKHWYWHIFAQGFLGNEREIVCVYDNSNNELAGFALLKRAMLEKKICTFYILPEYRESGLGHKFFPIIIDLLGMKDIGITVSESVNVSLQPLLNHNNFEFEKLENGLYLPGKKEIIYKLY